MRPEPGTVLAQRYELTRRIAVGGMGEVWEAHDRRTGVRVAAKVLRPELAGQQLYLDRLAAEARNSAQLDHPGIAAVYAHGEVDGVGYLVMQLVEGETLSEVLRREGRLPAATVLKIVADTADALAAAHESGVVHRDVKPANLIISPSGHVTITDFGISLGTDQAPMTEAGMVMGTAQYLPPEQAMGRAATGAGDVYALGIIAYEALVGHRPYTGATEVDIAFAHVTEPLPRLPEQVDEQIRTLVEQMLAKDPSERPSSALEVAARARDLVSQLEQSRWDPSAVRRAWHAVASLPFTSSGVRAITGGAAQGARAVQGDSADHGVGAAPARGAAHPDGAEATASRRRDRSSLRLRPPRSAVARRTVASVAVVILSAALTLLVLALAVPGGADASGGDPGGHVTRDARHEVSQMPENLGQSAGLSIADRATGQTRDGVEAW